MNAQNFLQQAARKARKRIRLDKEGMTDNLKAILALVEEKLFEPAFNVRQTGASASQLRRLRLALDQTLQKYIEDRRMETACELLAGTKLKVVEVAETTGFSSLQAFSRAFTRWSGERPSAYRQSHRRQQLLHGLPEPATPPEAPENADTVQASNVRDPSDDIWQEIRLYPLEQQGEKLLAFYPTDGHLVQFFCRKSRELRRDDAEASIHQANLATVAARLMVTEAMTPEDEKEHLRMRVESWVELGHAYREAGMTTRALRAASRADSWIYGRADIPWTARVHLLTLEAGIRRDEEKYRESIALIDKALALVPKDDKALVGDLLTKKGSAQSASGDVRGLTTIEKGLRLIREAEEKASTADDKEAARGRGEEAP